MHIHDVNNATSIYTACIVCNTNHPHSTIQPCNYNFNFWPTRNKPSMAYKPVIVLIIWTSTANAGGLWNPTSLDTIYSRYQAGESSKQHQPEKVTALPSEVCVGETNKQTKRTHL